MTRATSILTRTEKVMARTFERHDAERHMRVALLNGFTQLGHLTTMPVPVIASLNLGLVRPCRGQDKTAAYWLCPPRVQH